MQNESMTVVKVAVVWACFVLLTAGVSAREHILLRHVDHGRSTVIASATQATEGLVPALQTKNVSAVTQHFATLNGIVAALGKELPVQSEAIRAAAPEVLAMVLTNLRDTLVRQSALWNADERLNALCSGELKNIGDLAGPMLMAGLKDSDARVRAHSALAIGVLMGGQANFQPVTFSPGRGSFQNLFGISQSRLVQFRQGLAPLRSSQAIMDKIHEMIEVD